MADITKTEVERIQNKSKVSFSYDWYQTDSYVVVTVLIKNLKPEDVQVDFTDKTMSFSAALQQNHSFSLELDLANMIIPEESNYKILSTKVEIKLKKSDWIRWNVLEIDKDAPQITTKSVKEVADQAQRNPSTSHMYKDWDKLAKQIEEEDKKENLEGDAALNKLFQQIYADGSDEVKKAMNKSFQESGGTVLSTNWGEIKKETVPVKPPDCMEYKQYEY